MVTGIGVDLVEIDRIKNAIERHPRFVDRVYTPKEQRYCLAKTRPHHHFAVRFAAKEAVMKALGTGFKGLSWQEVEIGRDSSGRPFASLSGNGQRIADKQGVQQILISLSFSRGNAVASAIALGRDE